MDENCCPLCEEPLEDGKTVRLRSTKYTALDPNGGGVIESTRKIDAEVCVPCFVARIEAVFRKAA